MRIIPTKVHGVLDYLSAATLATLPRVLGWDSKVTNLLTGAAVGTLVYSLLTEYELGVVPVLPMRAHLALDGMSGASLCAAALRLRDQEEAGVVATLYGLGFFELAAATMTQTQPTARSIRQAASR